MERVRLARVRPVMTHVALHVRDVAASVEFYRRYCGMLVVHERHADEPAERVVWLAEPGRERQLIFVLVAGGARDAQRARDYSHLGFALASRAEVDAIATTARHEARLVWEAVEEPYPVGYYCGVRDPDGNVVEFSYGQPLGPGAPAPPSP
jgi:catechol 2,3-dioxygenase-like lactoylglutathione lyase family enzyme